MESKSILLIDLSARLPYGVFCNIGLNRPLSLQRMFVDRLDGILLDFYEDGNDYQVYLSEVKPYLRPLSSMTEEEKKELIKLFGMSQAVNEVGCTPWYNVPEKGIESVMFSFRYTHKLIDWLNAHHFDYRGLIEMGLALEAPEGMYK